MRSLKKTTTLNSLKTQAGPPFPKNRELQMNSKNVDNDDHDLDFISAEKMKPQCLQHLCPVVSKIRRSHLKQMYNLL
jgi:hypothetical protein